MQVEPQTPLPAVYQITNHLDPDRDAYYIRAVYRDSLTGTTLKALNLTANGNGRYAGSWQAPVDGTGLGRQIDATLTVYTDSGYSTKSDNYQEVIEKWYVKSAPLGGIGGMGGGAGTDIDYKRIAKIFYDELEAFVLRHPERELDLSGIFTVLDRIHTSVESIDIPESKETDLSPITTAIQGSAKSVLERIEGLPKPTEIDYGRIETIVDGSIDISEKIKKDVIDKLGVVSKEQQETISEIVETTIREVLKGNIERNQKVKEFAKLMLADEDIAPAPKSVVSPFSKYFKKP